MSVSTHLMTAEELLALPDDGVDRELIRGTLRETPRTGHGPPHARTMSHMIFLLAAWLHRQDRPRGSLYAGGIGVRLRRDPDTLVGVDLAYVSPDVEARTGEDAPFVDGAPVLAVEITSPSDTAESIAEKVREYLDAGVALVWQVDPYFHTVTVHRPDAKPELFNDGQDLSAEPHLPGFRAPVAKVFAP